MEREALKLAIIALGCIEYGPFGINDGPSEDTTELAITAIKAALAQPAQKPTGMLHIERLDQWLDASLKERKHREWVGLTDEDKQKFAAAQFGWEDLCLAVEARLKEKNT